MLNYLETAVIEISDPLFKEAGVRLLIKKESENHREVSGNKWWKLKYNLEEATRLGYKTLLTFGGAYSNHIFATSAAAKEAGLKSIGIIRGEETLPLNHTLTFAKSNGMQLQYVSRESYRRKNESEFLNNLKEKFGEFYLLPEGGTNHLAVKGCIEFTREKLLQLDFDYVCVPVGTGGTIAGIISGLDGQRQVIGFSSLKGGTFLNSDVDALLLNKKSYSNWEINTEYHFGGYGKMTAELKLFIEDQQNKNGLLLDEVYTSKMMFGIYDLIRKGKFKKGTTILMIHTGGLKGRTSIAENE